MALVSADRVQETSTTTGTGTYDLAGAVTGFQTFVAGIATANTCYYCATDGTNWEVGIGTVTDAATDTLARTTILKSSNANNAVSWAAGTRNIFCTIPALAMVASDTVAGLIAIALQSDMETATSLLLAVTPGRQQFHPSAAKMWARAAGAGTLTESFNMTSVTDTGTGDLDGTINVDFSTATWCLISSIVTGSADVANQFVNKLININAQAAGTFGLQSAQWTLDNVTFGNIAVALSDPTSYSIEGLGDQ